MRNICLFDKDTKEYTDVYSLTDGNGNHCAVTLWVDHRGQVNIDRPRTLPTVRVSASLEPDAWLAGEFIVIGVGDMRGGIVDPTLPPGTTTLRFFDLSKLGQDEFVIEHVDDGQVAIRCTVNATENPLQAGIVEC